jgi:hypothetical protein
LPTTTLTKRPYLRQRLFDEDALAASIFASSQQCGKNGGPTHVIWVGVIPAAVVKPRLANNFAVRCLAEEEERGRLERGRQREMDL